MPQENMTWDTSAGTQWQEGEPVNDERIYKIGLQQFHFMNLEDFFSIPLEEVSKNGEPKAVSTSCLEVLDEYLSCHQNLDRRISGRLVVE